jgi:hypothetical protein
MAGMTTRAIEALSALRERILTVADLWPVDWCDGTFAAPADGKFIREQPLGGAVKDAAIGISPRWRRWSEQWQLLIEAPLDVGYSPLRELADRIARALTESAIMLADNATQILITEVKPGALQEDATAGKVRLPVIVSYEFTATGA